MKRRIIETKQKENINKLKNTVINANVDTEYETFLREVRMDTLAFFNTVDFHTLKEDVVWQLVGVEFRLSSACIDEKYQKYSSEVRKRAYKATEPLGLKEGSSWLTNHDFINSDLKLGCMVCEFVSASPIFDIGYLMELFDSQGVPCFIDEESRIHINAEEPKKTEKPKMRTVC